MASNMKLIILCWGWDVTGNIYYITWVNGNGFNSLQCSEILELHCGAEAEKDDSILFFSNSTSKEKNVNVRLCCSYQGTCSGESTSILHPNVYTIEKQID